MIELTMRDLGLSDKNAGCSCCAAVPPIGNASTAAPRDQVSASFQVAGMTCSHCVASVTEELRQIAVVSGVDIELAPGGDSTVTITSTEPIDPAVVQNAVAEAGYRVVSTS